MRMFKLYLLLLTVSSSNWVYGQISNDNQVIADTTFVNLRDYSTEFHYDMKYAQHDNFLKAQVYDCGECYLRLKTVRALIEANKSAIEKGYRLKMYDCYRPLDIQKRMWKIVPNPTYVANPARGSIHNRGGAVDVTLVDSTGCELNMGTSFDHFGPEAAHKYKKFDRKILANRKLLRKIMEQNNFSPIASEWWHYNLNGSTKDSLANFNWECD